MTEIKKPLNCPFCGDKPIMYNIEPHSHYMQIEGFKMPDHKGSTIIECGCGAGIIDETQESVLLRWNKRDRKQTTEERDRIAQELEALGYDAAASIVRATAPIEPDEVYSPHTVVKDM